LAIHLTFIPSNQGNSSLFFTKGGFTAMDGNREESCLVDGEISDDVEMRLHALNDLQLALVGGGIGDTII
jgi:hypothetical protein